MIHTNVECGCVRLWEDLEHCGVQPSDVSELCNQCRNVSMMLLLALDLHPNIARIGTLHRYTWHSHTLSLDASDDCPMNGSTPAQL